MALEKVNLYIAKGLEVTNTVALLSCSTFGGIAQEVIIQIKNCSVVYV